jgi:hypothetical protein
MGKKKKKNPLTRFQIKEQLRKEFAEKRAYLDDLAFHSRQDVRLKKQQKYSTRTCLSLKYGFIVYILNIETNGISITKPLSVK